MSGEMIDVMSESIQLRCGIAWRRIDPHLGFQALDLPFEPSSISRGEENPHKKAAHLRRTSGSQHRTFRFMGYYGDELPRHGHRSPSELAEDEMISSLHGNVCMPSSAEQIGPPGVECVRHTRMSVVPWADAHPLENARAMQGSHWIRVAPLHVETNPQPSWSRLALLADLNDTTWDAWSAFTLSGMHRRPVL
jgi:hypothetical protein